MGTHVQNTSARKWLIGMISLFAVSACAEYYGQPISEIMANDPQAIESMPEAELCIRIKSGENAPTWSENDKKLTYKTLRKRGFSKRDADLISDRGVIYGTQMTFRGLKCTTGGGLKIVNKSFYPYLGHQWQVDIGNYQFVYLRGNGTETGMKVDSWN